MNDILPFVMIAVGLALVLVAVIGQARETIRQVKLMLLYHQGGIVIPAEWLEKLK